MKNKVVILFLVMIMTMNLTGCGSSNEEIARLNNLQSLNSESTVDSYTLTTSEKEEAVYAQVTERQLLDLTTLDVCSDNEKQQVLQFMNNVDAQLVGSLEAKDGVISEDYTNYLLMEFEKTPYYWQRSQTTIRGIDAESRNIVVDVTYKTINFKKDVQGSSYLVKGEPNYEQKMQIRYERWLQILNAKYDSQNISWESMFKQFKDVYGDPKDIFDSQRNLSLTESIYETGNQKSYSGLIDSEEEQTGGTMTIRYVLVPSYVLGISTGMKCSHMYKVSFSLDKDYTEDLELFKDDGYATINDSIYNLIYSYFTCIDESNYDGLYKLTKNFCDVDKYYSDYFELTYRKHNGFTVSLFDISGTKIKCGVSISSKERVKGSNMTYPIYTDRYYMQLELVDDTLQVTNIVLLSSTLEGEPAISTVDAETTGFISSIDLDNQDKSDIENLIANFSKLQLLNDTSSDEFGDTVDTSMSQSQLSELKDNMMTVTGDKKVVWLVNYMQGTESYACVKCRELYQHEDNSIYEADVTYEFINKGNKWYIYGYNVNSSVKLDTTNLTTTSSLCICTPGKIDSLSSQVVSTQGTQNNTDVESLGTTYEHEEYTPILKKGSKEQGLVKLTTDTLTREMLNEYYSQLMKNYGVTDDYADFSKISEEAALMDVITESSGVNINLLKSTQVLVCMYYNYINNRFLDLAEFNNAKDKAISTIDSTISSLRDLISSEDVSESYVDELNELENRVSTWITWIEDMTYVN